MAQFLAGLFLKIRFTLFETNPFLSS